MEKFSIRLVSGIAVPPPISLRLVDYLQQFVVAQILAPNRLILSAKPNVLLAFLVLETGNRLPHRIQALKLQQSGNDKLFNVIIPAQRLRAADDTMAVADILYEGVACFLTTHYKRITPELMEGLKNKLDRQLLQCIPYPAPAAEVRYLGHA